jgi:hypothetical protein
VQGALRRDPLHIPSHQAEEGLVIARPDGGFEGGPEPAGKLEIIRRHSGTVAPGECVSIVRSG